MSYALRRLTSAISRSNSIVIFINQLRAAIGSGYSSGPSETTTGGRALKFYTSVRIEVKRGKAVTKGDVAIGHELWIKVVKNKQAPPFRTAHTTLVYGKGIPRDMSVVDMALDMEVIKRKGSWIAYKGETIGQGKDNVATYLVQHPDLMDEIIREVLAKAAAGIGILPAPSETEEEGGEESSRSEGVFAEEEGVLDLEPEKPLLGE